MGHELLEVGTDQRESTLWCRNKYLSIDMFQQLTATNF